MNILAIVPPSSQHHFVLPLNQAGEEESNCPRRMVLFILVEVEAMVHDLRRIRSTENGVWSTE